MKGVVNEGKFLAEIYPPHNQSRHNHGTKKVKDTGIGIEDAQR